MIDEGLNLLPDVSPDIVPESTPEPISEPILELTPESMAPPMEVISVDELIDRLTQGGDETDSVPEESQESAEPSPGEPGDTAAVELAPDTLAIMDTMDGFNDELAQLSGQLTEIQQHLARPALTTSFADYTVMEALLLLLLLLGFAAVCIRMLKGGFKWLRS